MASANRVFINGRFLTQKTTGVQRFAREIVLALDHVLAAQGTQLKVSLIAPEGTPALPGLSRINFVPFGKRHGHLWEQVDLLRAARGGFLVNLGASGPVLKRRQLTIIHDAAVYRRPENYSFPYRTAHQTLGRILARTSKLGTVSEFSRGELADVLHLREKDIAVIPDGHEHILPIAPQDDILDRLSLRERPYFLFVGSPAPNKNLARAIEAFDSLQRPDVTFVIVGSTQKAVFHDGAGEMPPNVVMSGRLSDGEVVSLYRHAHAFVLPSLYEGFGIPPLEAMAHGCPVIASRIPPVEEVCGDAALYFDPLKVEEIAARMKEIVDSNELRLALIGKGATRYPLFSWKESARRLVEGVNRLASSPV